MSWTNQEKPRNKHFLTFQNGKTIQLQNGNLLITHQSYEQWENDTPKSSDVWTLQEKT